MPCTAKRAETDGASSTFTLITLSRPARPLAACSTPGAISRHGPHHGAQRSSSTGRRVSTTSSKSSWPAATSQGRSVWHEAQRGVPAAAAGTRFLVPHEGQAVILDTAAAYRGGYVSH